MNVRQRPLPIETGNPTEGHTNPGRLVKQAGGPARLEHPLGRQFIDRIRVITALGNEAIEGNRR
jgi:hypothetical protein